MKNKLGVGIRAGYAFGSRVWIDVIGMVFVDIAILEFVIPSLAIAMLLWMRVVDEVIPLFAGGMMRMDAHGHNARKNKR